MLASFVGCVVGSKRGASGPGLIPASSSPFSLHYLGWDPCSGRDPARLAYVSFHAAARDGS